MTRDLVVAAASINQTPLDFEGNAHRIQNVLTTARAQGVELLCLPELCISGYGCEDAFYFPSVIAASEKSLLKVIPETKGLVVTLGLPLKIKGALYNGVAVVADGELKGIVCKQHLANDGIHYETRWFDEWKQGETEVITIHGMECPVGDLLFDLDGMRIGFEICEDAWVSDRTGSSLVSTGVSIILNPSASHFSLGKRKFREKIVLSGSKEFEVVYVYANLLGNEAGKIIYDGDTIIAQDGKILASGERLSFSDSVLTKAVVCPKRKDHPKVIDQKVISIARSASLKQSPAASEAGAYWEQSSTLVFEEFARAVSLGLFDYLRKSKAHGFVVSLSGGADSSATALLCKLSCILAIEKLGVAGFKEKLSHIDSISLSSRKEEIIKTLLTTVYQKTVNSSSYTEDSAAEVALLVGSSHESVSIQELVGSYTALAQKVLGRNLSWELDDLALQNIQARVRSPGIWFIANVKKALLLTTCNRSEVVVGYATMDGDTSGSLAPIAGVSKHFLKQWLLWMEQSGLKETGPYPQLRCVNELIPTAELRPLSAAQQDEKDLMPYPLLDAFERGILEEKLSKGEMLEKAVKDFPEYPKKDISNWLDKFYQLFKNSQWKRERLAPSFHIDTLNVDPRSWLRFPILSGGLR